MTIIAGVCMMRNEEDVCVRVVRHLLEGQGVDHVLVADNLSSDRTRSLLNVYAAHEPRLTVITDSERLYHQGQKMTLLAHMAHHRFSADWIIPFDADELWSGKGRRRLCDMISEVNDQGFDSATADKVEFVPHELDDPNDNDPFSRMRHCEPEIFGGYKTAFRWQKDTRIGAGNHRVSTQGRCANSVMLLRHYSVRTFNQARSKFRHGASVIPANWSPDMGAHWRDLGTKDDTAFAAWWAAYTDPGRLVTWDDGWAGTPGSSTLTTAATPEG